MRLRFWKWKWEKAMDRHTKLVGSAMDAVNAAVADLRLSIARDKLRAELERAGCVDVPLAMKAVEGEPANWPLQAERIKRNHPHLFRKGKP